MKTELKPCPFCGGKAFVYEHTCIKNRPTYYTTHCTACGVSDLKHHKSTDDATEAWNRRVDEI
jgi:Lar family restriction alleviation protein